MALTPGTIRSDKKCGASAIPDNKRCRVGGATSASPRGRSTSTRPNWNRGSGLRRNLERAAIAGGAATYVGGLAGTAYHGLRGNYIGALRSTQVSNLGGGLVGAGLISAGQRTKNKKLTATGGVLTGLSALQAGLTEADIRRATQARQAWSGASYKNAEQEWQSATNRGGYKGRTGSQRQAPPPKPPKYKGDPFSDLGINKNASAKEVRAAYLRLAKKNHPDMGGDAETMKRINAAYEEAQRRMREEGRGDEFDLYPSVWAYGFTP